MVSLPHIPQRAEILVTAPDIQLFGDVIAIAIAIGLVEVEPELFELVEDGGGASACLKGLDIVGVLAHGDDKVGIVPLVAIRWPCHLGEADVLSWKGKSQCRCVLTEITLRYSEQVWMR